MISTTNSVVTYVDNYNRCVKVYLDDDGCIYEKTRVNKKEFGFTTSDLPTWMPEDQKLTFVEECKVLFGDWKVSPRKGIKHITLCLERSEEVNSDEYKKLIGIFSEIGHSERVDMYIGQGGYGYLTEINVYGENLVQKLLDLYQKTPEIWPIYWTDDGMQYLPSYMYNYKTNSFVHYNLDDWKQLYSA